VLFAPGTSPARKGWAGVASLLLRQRVRVVVLLFCWQLMFVGCLTRVRTDTSTCNSATCPPVETRAAPGPAPERVPPRPSSQIFSRSYDSSLPTSLTYILPRTRGCSPWRPDAVSSTPGGRVKDLRGPGFSRAVLGALDRVLPSPASLFKGDRGLKRTQLCRGSPELRCVTQFRSHSPARQKEKRALPRAKPGVARSLRVAARHRRTPVPECQPDSLSLGRPRPPRPPSRARAGGRGSSAAFASRLGATHSCPIAVHTKPCSTSVHKGSTCVVATSTKICTGGRSTPPHGRASSPSAPFYKNLNPHALLLAAPYPQGRRGRMRRPLERHPFSGLQDSAGGLLHTP